MVIQNSEKDTFEERWKWLAPSYPNLVEYAGGLQSVFPTTATVESDFSIMGWERNEYRQRLSSFALEGIMHAKQFEEIKDIESKF